MTAPTSANTPASPAAEPAAALMPETRPAELAQDAEPREVVLVTGISGSGKSVALHALEDAGYFCVDNLPPELLRDFIHVERAHGVRKMAIAVDVRTAGSLPYLLPVLDQLRAEGVLVRSVFLNATTTALVKRFSETRRPHPLDTSQLRPAQLRLWIRDLVGATSSQLTLVFESFAFKHGVPLDADLVFDVRVLPNPFYIRELRPLTGRDAPVADYLQSQPEVGEMLDQIDAFVRRWLPAFEDDQRSYLTVAIGCTGGQHRSAYFVEQLARRFEGRWSTLKRHRELDARP